MSQTKIFLDERDMPRQWYNIQADLPKPLPPVLHPGTKQPIGPGDLAPLFPMGLILQEVSQERYLDIPEEVLDIYRIWRPTPLVRARRLEKALGTPAHIYYKWEGVSPAGSHKPNTAVPQAYYNKVEGVKRLTTETGAGQWGSALAFACSLFEMECKVYMVRVSYDQKPYRRLLMEAWGASCIASPSEQTGVGRAILARDPDSPGSLGIAISEAVEEAGSRQDTNYSLGSVLNHVMLHQTVIGLETHKQLELAGDYPDVVIGCVGGGSNFAGLALPFVRDKITAGKKTRIVAAEPTACPSLTRGLYRYDFGDSAGLTPLLKMHTLGHDFMPPPIHAGGLRYHGMAPILCHLLRPRPDRGGGPPAERGVPVGGAVRAHRGTPAGAGDGARHPRSGRGGAALPGARRGEDHRVRRERPRALRPGLVPEVLRRGAPGPRVPGGADPQGPGFAAGGLSGGRRRGPARRHGSAGRPGAPGGTRLPGGGRGRCASRRWGRRAFAPRLPPRVRALLGVRAPLYLAASGSSAQPSQPIRGANQGPWPTSSSSRTSRATTAR